jgi:hypothetical protein
MEIKKRIHFKDEGQDLTHVDVELFRSTGIIRDVPMLCSDVIVRMYVDKAILVSDMKVGKHFEYADPKDDFKVTVSRWIIEEIENL